MPPRPKFFAKATGPQGGAVYKFGVSAVSVGIRHEQAPQGIEVRAFLDDKGLPHVSVNLTTPPRLLYSGPLQPHLPDSPFFMTSQLCRCGRTMRVFEVEDGCCVGCAGLAPVDSSGKIE